MSSLTTNPARSAQRAQMVAEAVVSTYIHEIAATQHTRKPARTRGGCAESPNATARSPLAARPHTRARVPRRRPALQLGA